MTPQTLVAAWTPQAHPSLLVAELWFLGEYALIRRAGDAFYGLVKEGSIVEQFTDLTAGKNAGAGLWAGEITLRFQGQQLEAYEDANDVVVSDQGSIVTFRPCTSAGTDWIADNVQDDAQWFGGALVVEHRYAPYLIEGMVGAGLSMSSAH